MAVNLHLVAFRFGTNGDTESTHGWWGAENANVSLPQDTTFLLRMGIQQVEATAAANLAQQFQAKVNAGEWFNITTSSTYVKAVTPTTFANNAASTTRLTTLTGNRDTSNANCTTDGTSGGTANDVPASGHSETVCGLQIRSDGCAVGDVISFQLTISGPTTTLTIDVVPQSTVGAKLTSVIPDDANEAYADSVEVLVQRVGWIDSVLVDVQESGGEEPTPIEVSGAGVTDSWATLDDAAPTVDRRGNHIYALAADVLGSYADAAPTIDRRGNQLYSLPADALGTGIDAVNGRFTLSHAMAPDAWGNLADAAPTVVRGVIYKIALSADPWETLADSAPTITTGVVYKIVLADDAFPAYTDSIDKTTTTKAEQIAQAIWESVTRTLVSGTPDEPTNDAERVAKAIWEYATRTLTASPNLQVAVSDDLGGFEDADLSLEGGYEFVLAADSLGSSVDAVVTAQAISVAVSSGLNAWADSVTRYSGVPFIQVALAADAMPATADAIAIRLAHLVRLSDTWREGPLRPVLSDTLNFYGDSVARYSPFAYAIDVQLSDANAAYADTVGNASPLFVTPGEPTLFAWTWTQTGGDPILGFNVYYGTVPGAPIGYLQIADPIARSIAIDAVVPPGAWYISVRAYNDAGTTAASNEVFYSYARLSDAVSATWTTVNLSLVDAKPAFADSVVPKLGLRIVHAADANDAYTDAVDVNPFTNIPVSLSDANTAYADAILVEETKPYALTDANAVYADSVVHALGYYFVTHIEVTPSADANAEYTDAIAVNATELSAVVTPDDANEAYADSVTVSLSQASDLVFHMTEAMNAYVDNILRGLSISVDVPDDAMPEPVDSIGSASGTGRMHPIISSRGVHSLIYGGMIING